MPTATPFNNLITFSRGSNATVTGSNGLIQWAPNNLLTFSEQFDNAAWGKVRITAAANTSLAPDGTTTADTLNGSGGGTTSISQTMPAVGGLHTATVYAKAGTKSVIQFSANAFAWGADARANFDIANGVLGTVDAGLTATITPTGDGWYRCAVTANKAATAGALLWCIVDSTTAAREAAATAGSVIFWGAQLELGSTATAYNATTVKNLLGFSEAFDNAAWTKSNSSIVTGAQANPINGLFTAQKLMENTANSVHRFIVGATVTAIPYTLSIYAKAAERNWIAIGNTSDGQLAHFNLTSGTVGTILGGATAAISNVGSGWYRCSVTFTPTAGSRTLAVWLASADNTLTYTGDGNSGVYIYGAQLSDSASLDPYVPTPGAAPSSTAFYGPRFDFDPVTLQPRGILIEEQRTNLATYSNDFADASWTAFGTKNLVANSTVSPDGAVNASTLTDNSAVAFQGMGKTVTVANDNTTYTASIYVRKTTGGTSATFGVNLQLTGGTLVTAQPRLNTDTGALINGTGTVQNAGAYWRLTTTVTNNTTGNTTLALAVYPATAAYNSGTDSAAATGSAIIYGAQLEAGAFATSYIPTVASTVTRSADVATISGQNFAQWFGPATGTLVAEYQAVAGVSMDIAMTSDGTPLTNSLGIYSSNGTSDVGWCRAGGVNQAVISAPSTATTAHKAAFGYEANNFGISAAGSAVVADTAGSIPTINLLRLGGAVSGVSGTNQAFWFRSFRFIPARAADFQLQAITT